MKSKWCQTPKTWVKLASLCLRNEINVRVLTRELFKYKLYYTSLFLFCVQCFNLVWLPHSNSKFGCYLSSCLYSKMLALVKLNNGSRPLWAKFDTATKWLCNQNLNGTHSHWTNQYILWKYIRQPVLNWLGADRVWLKIFSLKRTNIFAYNLQNTCKR